ncbi:hypothetical protein E4T56_gene9721 [Termitomyces sp. T112]|nr:hypothetical protein E4T56_gene9721 [Termitomyces sp. T112]
MSVYNPTYNLAGYLTGICGQPVPDNPYAPFYPGPSADYQGMPLGWHHPPAFSANGNNPHIYSRGYSAAPSNPAYLSPTHYYAYPAPLEHIDDYSPPHLPFSAQVPPSLRQQRVEAYAQ